jgi:hypothetical protein
MTYTPEAPKPVVENPGFTLIEDDDVAFSISLCREIHRIYGTYQDGELEATDSVRAGLNLTTEMFAVLQNTVTDGMPAMRLEVGAAQAREMMAALFGEGFPSSKSREVRSGRSRSCGRRNSPALGGGSRHRAAIAETIEAVPAPAITPLALPSEPRWTEQPEVGFERSAAHPSRAHRAFRSLFRTLLAIIAVCVGAVLIDVPFAVLALYPNHFLPLSVAFLTVGLGAGAVNRIIRSRRALSV